MTISAPILLRHYSKSEQTQENLSYVLLKGETVLIQNDDNTWTMRIGDGISTIQQLIDENKGLITTYIPRIELDNDQLDDIIENIITCEDSPLEGISSHQFFKDLAKILLMMNNIRNYNIK